MRAESSTAPRVALINTNQTRRLQRCLIVSPVPTFATPTSLPLQAAFDGGRLTSDGGLPWLAEADAALELYAMFAAHVPHWRRGSIQHSLETLLRQRIFQIACG